MSATVIFDGDNVTVTGVIRVVDFQGNDLSAYVGDRIASDLQDFFSGDTQDIQNYYNGAQYHVTSHFSVTTQDGPGVTTFVLDPDHLHGAFSAIDSDTIYVQVDPVNGWNPINSSKGEFTFAHEFLHRTGSGDTPRTDGDVMDSE